MRNVSGQFYYVCQLAATLLSLIVDAGCYLGLCLRPNPTLAAENLFLRKQLALYQERQVKPRRATNATRITLVWLGQWFDWRRAFGIVKPKTFISWHRQAYRLFWRWKSKPGRPALPKDLQGLIRRQLSPSASAFFSSVAYLLSISHVACGCSSRRASAHFVARMIRPI